MAAKLKLNRVLRDTAIKDLTDVHDLGLSISSDSSLLGLFKLRASRNDEIKARFTSHQSEIVAAVVHADDDIEPELQIGKKFMDMYYATEFLLSTLVSPSSESSNANSNASPKSNIKLPKIELPTFDGSLKQWQLFRDLFNVLVHTNSQLSDVEKLHYLRSALTKEPAHVIRGFTISGNNYMLAYEALTKRYDSPRRVVFSCWEELLKVTYDSKNTLRKLTHTFSENLAILKQQGFQINELADFIIFHCLFNKLDINLRESFERKHPDTSAIPSYAQLQSFLESECNAIENAEITSRKNTQRINSYSKTTSCVTNTMPSQYVHKCPLCAQTHKLINCTQFQKSSPKDRHALVKSLKRCINCLGPHVFNKCSSKHTCRLCSKKHHSTLHFEYIDTNIESNNRVNTPIANNRGEPTINIDTSSSNTINSCAGKVFNNLSALIPTVLLEICDKFGRFHVIRALVDSGSQASFISKKFTNKLLLSPSRLPISIQGVGCTASPATFGKLRDVIFRPINSSQQLTNNFIILKHICSDLPTTNMDQVIPDEFTNLKLADPYWFKSSPIDLLLGADIYSQIIRPNIIKPISSHLTALDTIFGWTLIGSTPQITSAPIQACCASLALAPLDTILKNFWEIENINDKPLLTGDDLAAEQHFVKHCKQASSGRFEVALPFTTTEPVFPHSRDIADRRLIGLEKRLSTNPTLKLQYHAFLQQYLDQGHMQIHDVAARTDHQYFLPHFGVFKQEDISQTNIRVVFDGAAKSSNGRSLNDVLLTGPKLQTDIQQVLIRFRVHPVAFTCDIKDMYRQISVRPPDRHYQMIRWRFNPESEIQTYQLNTVTYGVSSAPFLAIRVLHKLASDNATRFPLAAHAVRHNIYVDDVQGGGESAQAAIELRDELIQLLKTAGMELRKWASNSSEVLNDIPMAHHRTCLKSLDDNESDIIKVLGLHWDATADSFLFKVVPKPSICTKRAILSNIARVFDPLGFLSPTTLFAKLMIQQLWTLGIEWDDTPPPEICNRWSAYLNQLTYFQSVSVPRFLFNLNYNGHFELHGFCDASEGGYAAVVYVRTLSDFPSVKLLIAKNKVAPLKKLSLPRLELCGAHLLSKLVSFTLSALESFNQPTKIYAWSDSSVVLSWIKSPSYRWNTFVANRVAKIQEHIHPQSWRYVPSKQNPADPASRGLLPAELLHCTVWWAGPEFLTQPSDRWPAPLLNLDKACVSSELKRQALTINIITNPFLDLIERISSLRKLQGIVSYCLRFSKENSFIGPLTEAELYSALFRLVYIVQQVVFKTELKLCAEQRPLSKTLLRLSPFIDKNGLLRVGGRLSNSDLAYDTKHPALLPRRHRLTEMIIHYYHYKYFHPGVSTTLYLLQQSFWILGGRQAVRRVLFKCHVCFRQNPKHLQPRMADLPAFRVAQAKPFSQVGVDFAGPYSITLSKSRGAKSSKAYICIFVCCVIKAIHIELVSSLSSEAFIAALRRFIARRGRCNYIISDNGTNFVGANRQLLKLCQNAAQTESIKWKFNPPAAPHFGGLYESGIKSIKTHLHRILGNRTPSYEEFYTLLVQVEALLNSRPIAPLSSDPNDLSILTPGHFLTTEALSSPSDPVVALSDLSLRSRWAHIQKMLSDFWSRWQNEYLHTLYQRAKWSKQGQAVEGDFIGKMVLIKEENTPPLQWRFGRITNVYPGGDGIVRVADVKTVSGKLRRPLTKLCLLPINN